MMVKGGVRATSVGNGKTVIVDRKQSSKLAGKYGDGVAKAVQRAAEKGKPLNKTALVALLTVKGSKLSLKQARNAADKIISDANKGVTFVKLPKKFSEKVAKAFVEKRGQVGNPLKAKADKMQVDTNLSKVFSQKFENGDAIYFRPTEQLKNGKYKGELVRMGEDVRGAGKIVNKTADLKSGLWSEVKNVDEIPKRLQKMDTALGNKSSKMQEPRKRPEGSVEVTGRKLSKEAQAMMEKATKDDKKENAKQETQINNDKMAKGALGNKTSKAWEDPPDDDSEREIWEQENFDNVNPIVNTKVLSGKYDADLVYDWDDLLVPEKSVFTDKDGKEVSFDAMSKEEQEEILDETHASDRAVLEKLETARKEAFDALAESQYMDELEKREAREDAAYDRYVDEGYSIGSSRYSMGSSRRSTSPFKNKSSKMDEALGNKSGDAGGGVKVSSRRAKNFAKTPEAKAKVEAYQKTVDIVAANSRLPKSEVEGFVGLAMNDNYYRLQSAIAQFKQEQKGFDEKALEAIMESVAQPEKTKTSSKPSLPLLVTPAMKDIAAEILINYEKKFEQDHKKILYSYKAAKANRDNFVAKTQPDSEHYKGRLARLDKEVQEERLHGYANLLIKNSQYLPLLERLREIIDT